MTKLTMTKDTVRGYDSDDSIDMATHLHPEQHSVIFTTIVQIFTVKLGRNQSLHHATLYRYHVPLPCTAPQSTMRT